MSTLVAPLTVSADKPAGSRVVVSPEPGKPPDLFAAEQDFCRSDAESTFDSDVDEGGGVLRSAVVGTVLGAAAGAVLSGRHHDNTGLGAVAGMVMGAANGASRQAALDENAQRRYDRAYEQCMVAKGNGVPQVMYLPTAPRYSAPPPSTTPPDWAQDVPPDFPSDMPRDMPPSYLPPPPPPQRPFSTR